MCPQNSCVDILLPNVLALGGKSFGRWLGHHEWDQYPYEKSQHTCSLSCALLHVRIQWRNRPLQTMKQTLSRHWICWSLGLGLPSFQDWEINFCCLSYPICGILLWLSELRHWHWETQFRWVTKSTPLRTESDASCNTYLVWCYTIKKIFFYDSDSASVWRK